MLPLGSELSRETVVVTAKEVRRFADTVEDPYVPRTVEAARAAGHRGIPLPPTYGFSLLLDRPNAFDIVHQLGIDFPRMLHAEQRFTYHGPLVADEPIELVERYKDRYDKKDGALQFHVLEGEAYQGGKLALSMERVLVVVRQ